MEKINMLKVSKTMSYILRHNPYEFGLILDEEGWGDIYKLLNTLQIHNERLYDLKLSDILQIVKDDTKGRYEVKDDKIRAVYGHSIKNIISKQKSIPPEFLYHGTAHRFLDSIKNQGLLKMDRQYVHMSEDINTAKLVGKRRDDLPVILKIRARECYTKKGISFFKETNGIWLSQNIPYEFITIESE